MCTQNSAKHIEAFLIQIFFAVDLTIWLSALQMLVVALFNNPAN